ncbi:MAG: QueT transporter family protein [Eubacterium sp.]|nr:QueT transporter family protein [Eubacterium sp.]
MIFGSLATLGSSVCIYFLKNAKIKTYPLFAMLMPAVWNGIIIGWEIEAFFIEGPFHVGDFFVQGGLVALGELGVMLTLGTALYYIITKRHLDKKIFE